MNITFIKENWHKLILSIPIGLYILGSLIKNIFLIQYGIVDFNPFQIDLIYTGIVFVIIVTLHLYFFSYKTPLLQEKYNYVNIIQEIVIIIILCNFEILFFYKYFNNTFLFEREIEGLLISNIIIKIIFMTSFFYILYPNPINKTDKIPFLDKLLYKILNIFIPIVNIILFVLINYLYHDVLYVILFTLILGFGYIRSKYKMNENEETINKTEKSTKNERSSISKIIQLFLPISIVIIVLIFVYSNTIYPRIPRNLGGNLPVKIKIDDEENNTLSGELIHQNQNKLFILIGKKLFVLNDNRDYEIEVFSDKPILFTSIIKTE